MGVPRRRGASSTPPSEVERSLRIQINGEPREIADETNLAQLVSLLQLKPEQVAIELNRTVVRRADWSESFLREDDTLEIVHFVGGGNHPQITQITQMGKRQLS